jgi:putative toxin-antitoxin system antitoxin component (TIGR02293 family)
MRHMAQQCCHMARGRKGAAAAGGDVASAAVDPATRAYDTLLGLAPGTLPNIVYAIERGLSYRTFERFVANSSMSTAATAALVNIPVRTLSRRKREGRLHPDESDRLLRASRVVGRAIELFEGDRAEAKQWLARSQRALGGATPFEIARTEVGALAVERLIDQLEQGIFV